METLNELCGLVLALCASMFSVMDNPSTLEENLERLATQMVALKYLSNRVATVEPVVKERIEGNVNDFEEILREFDVIDGQDFRGTIMAIARIKLNTRVLGSLKAVTALNEDVKAVMESIQTSLPDVEGDKPRLQAETSLKEVNEASLNHMMQDKLQLNVVAPFKKMTERPLVDMKSEVKPFRFDLEDLEDFTLNFGTQIGADSFGKDFRGQFPTGEQIVVKVLTEDDMNENRFKAEVNILSSASHKNLVRLHGFCFDQDIKALVYDYMHDGSSLDKVLHQNCHGHIEWEKFLQISIQIAMGLSYLHEGGNHQIIHRDLCSSHILLDSSFSAKISDFGIAKLLSRDDSSVLSLETYWGQPTYPAPEIFESSSKITFKSDVYSFGMLLFEILWRKQDHRARNLELRRSWERYEDGQLDQLLDEWEVGDGYKDKAKLLCMVGFWCAQFKPQCRPSMSTVVKMLNMEIPVRTPPNPFTI